ncbi:serine hydrolase domain-containing protein [Saccharibacillus sp. CPCC 101409]|uniref:serine hydrolase domain-containing protein n=1 Tax=Saccharibacillus sp. CPCC 101409 TaxID=3058041 RepID=UPI002673B725|nr:serine hydrolase domain-containing protein [Saccharibacillus sp. CPCC 101409]MDO3410900.1 serine hydrolase domain-containing protein [Saccharibacillus sp. CPCC 101409]
MPLLFYSLFSTSFRRAVLILLILPFLLMLHSTNISAQSSVPQTTPSGIPLDGLEAYIDRFVEPYIGHTVAAASIAVVKDGRIVLSKAYGYADADRRIPAEPETVFEWGSISKLLVWTSVMQLEESGKLDLKADIRKYLPSGFLTRLKYDDPITLLHLMNHTAGFEEYMFDMAYTSPEQVKSLEAGLLLAEPAQIYRPGENVAYSNYGNSLAAYIVERVSGEPYNEYVNRHILVPLGMKQTEVLSVLKDRPDLERLKATGYLSAEKGAFAKGPWNYMSMYPNGGSNGTAEDLARFAAAFLPEPGGSSPLFRKPDTLRLMLSSSHSVDSYMPGIAHGFWEYPGASRTLGHGGNTQAFSSGLELATDQRFAVIVLTNQAGEANLVHGLAHALLGDPNIPSTAEILPDSSLVSGSFITARRPEQGFMSVYPYLSLMRVASETVDTVNVNLVGYEGQYRQIRPYLYQKVNGDAALDAWPLIHFDYRDGRVTRVSVYTTDYLPLPANRPLPILTVQAAIAVCALLFFLLVPPILILVWFFRRKVRNRYSKTLRIRILAFLFSGTLLVVNILVLAYRMLSQNERPYREVLPQLILNDIFAAAGLIFLILLLLELKRHPTPPLRLKIGIALAAVLWILLIALLILWQFYR